MSGPVGVRTRAVGRWRRRSLYTVRVSAPRYSKPYDDPLCSILFDFAPKSTARAQVVSPASASAAATESILVVRILTLARSPGAGCGARPGGSFGISTKRRDRGNWCERDRESHQRWRARVRASQAFEFERACEGGGRVAAAEARAVGGLQQQERGRLAGYSSRERGRLGGLRQQEREGGWRATAEGSRNKRRTAAAGSEDGFWTAAAGRDSAATSVVKAAERIRRDIVGVVLSAMIRGRRHRL